MADKKLERFQERFTNLIADTGNTDPKLKRALELLGSSVTSIIDRLEPIEQARSTDLSAQSSIPGTPSGLTIDISSKENIRISWQPSDDITRFYEVRKRTTPPNLELEWDSADYVTTTSALGVILSPETYGPHYFMVKAVSNFGVYSGTYVYGLVTVTQIPAPVVTAINSSNNVVLFWTEPVSDWYIDYYKIYKDGVLVLEVSGTSASFFERVPGTYTYSVVAVDLAGNVGTAGFCSITVPLSGDYSNLFNQDVALSTATLTNAKYDSNDNVILAPVNTSEDYQTHFTSNPTGSTWNTPADQVAAGYDFWIQDNPTGTGIAEIVLEAVDFGVEIQSAIVNINATYDLSLAPPNEPVVHIWYRSASSGFVYTDWAEGTTGFLYLPAQYFQVKLVIDNASPDSMMSLSRVNIDALVVKEIDSGVIALLASDADGTVLYTDGTPGGSNKIFSKPDSVTLTTSDNEPIYISATEYKVVLPSGSVIGYFGYKIKAYDSGGNRVSKTVNWKVRGLVRPVVS